MEKHLKAVPISLKDANAFVDAVHRHHQHAVRDKFRCAAAIGDKVVGVAQVGRPVSRMLDDGETLEVVRLCTDGTQNACSFLYSRACAIAKLMGYKKIITYTLETEPGTSLIASGFTLDGVTQGGGWSRPSRKRETKAPTCPKKRWVKILTKDKEE